MFLSATVSGFPRVSWQEAQVVHFGASIEGLTFLMDSVSFSVFNGFSFHGAWDASLLRICCCP